MSKLSKFLGQPKEVEIQGEMLKIYPLNVEDLKIFVGKENSSPEEQMELSKILIKKSLKDEDITDEEMGNMVSEVFMKIINEINKLNGFKDENVDRIKQLKEQNLQQKSK